MRRLICVLVCSALSVNVLAAGGGAAPAGSGPTELNLSAIAMFLVFVVATLGITYWAAGRTRLRMEDFYRAQRLAFEVLLDGYEPAGGRWNFDHDNREPPPRDGRAWPRVERFGLDEVDLTVIDEMECRSDV